MNQDIDDVPRVGSNEEMLRDLDQGGLCAVMGSVARLTGFKEFMVGCVLMELCGYCSLQDLAEEVKAGDRR